MKAFVVEHYGKDGLRAVDVPEPEVGDGDVLVKVSAASINPLDKMVRDGEFKRLLKYQTPFVLGHDGAGVVTRVGAAVRDFQVGDEVYARPGDLLIGTFAEYIAIDRGRCRAQASLADPARGGRGAARVTGCLAGPRRPRPRAARPESPSPCRLRRPRLDRHPAGQPPRRHGGDDRERRERGAGAQ